MLSQGAVDGRTNFMYYEGSPKAVFDLVFDIFSTTGLPLGGFMMSIFIATRWKLNNFNKELAIGNDGYLGSLLNKFLNFSIVFFAPLFLGIMFITTVLQKFFGVVLF